MAILEEMKKAMAGSPLPLNIRGRKSLTVEAFNASAAELRAEGKPLFNLADRANEKKTENPTDLA